MAKMLDETFPLAVGFGATGGPERRTEIVSLATGEEARNARWADSRRHYDAATGVRSLEDMRAVLTLFEKARGQLYGFRFRDPFDQTASLIGSPPAPTDCQIGVGDGASTVFQLIKTYGSGSLAYSRTITLPAGSLRIAVAGVELTAGTDFDLGDSGLVTLTEAPVAEANITAGFLFDVPVRFDTDRIEASLTHFRAGEVPSIPLIEIRL